MFSVEKWRFFKLFVSGNIEQDNAFYDILKGRNAFLGYKNKKFKTSKKIVIFSKGLIHGFCEKKAFFQLFLKAI